MDCIKKELEYTTQELKIQRENAKNQKAEFEKVNYLTNLLL